MRPLDGPRLKVVRAREHLQEIHFQQGRFFESNPYSVTDEFDAKAGKHVFRIHVHRDPPKHRLAALVGDCVHNLRSALDHLVWRLSEDFGGSNDADTMTQFPIFRTEVGYDTRGINQIVRVGPGAAAIIRLLQPFHFDPPILHPLWMIRELDNGDKHRELAVTAVAAKGYAQRIHPPKGTQGTYRLRIIIEDIKDGEIIAELVLSPPDPQVGVETRWEFQIALTAPTVPYTDPRIFVMPFLDQLARRVSGVINCFEPFYATGAYDDTIVIADPLAPYHSPPPSPEPELPKRSDATHEAFAERAKEQINAGVDAVWEAVTPLIDQPEVIEKPLRSALVQSALNGFLLGTEMSLERVEENRSNEMTIPPEETEQR